MILKLSLPIILRNLESQVYREITKKLKIEVSCIVSCASSGDTPRMNVSRWLVTLHGGEIGRRRAYSSTDREKKRGQLPSMIAKANAVKGKTKFSPLSESGPDYENE